MPPRPKKPLNKSKTRKPDIYRPDFLNAQPGCLDGPFNVDCALWPDDSPYELTPAEIAALRKQYQRDKAWGRGG